MALSFCPFCGTKYSNIPDKYTHQYCESCDKIFYRNSVPAVAILIQKHDKLLLGKRKYDPAKGTWDFIGGFMEPGEEPAHTAIRETKEETGLDVTLTKLLLTYTDVYPFKGEVYPLVNFIYIGEVVAGEEKPNDDVEELKWFDVDNLPTEMSSPKQFDVLKAWKNSLNNDNIVDIN